MLLIYSNLSVKIEDQQGVVAGLSASTSLDAKQLLNYMQQKNIGMGV